MPLSKQAPSPPTTGLIRSLVSLVCSFVRSSVCLFVRSFVLAALWCAVVGTITTEWMDVAGGFPKPPCVIVAPCVMCVGLPQQLTCPDKAHVYKSQVMSWPY